MIGLAHGIHALETRLHTISQEILSRSRLDALIRQFNLYDDLRRRVPLEEVIERMRKDIKLELKSVQQTADRRAATVAFALSYDGRNPETVARVTNTLASSDPAKAPTIRVSCPMVIRMREGGSIVRVCAASRLERPIAHDAKSSSRRMEPP